jgi:WD40 repeat protein
MRSWFIVTLSQPFSSVFWNGTRARTPVCIHISLTCTRCLHVAGDDGTVRIWQTNLVPWVVVYNLTVYRTTTLATPRSIRSVAWHSTGRYLAVAGVAWTCRVYDAVTWQPISWPPASSTSLANLPTVGYTVEWNPKGNELLYDGQLYTLQESTTAMSVATMAFLQLSTTLPPALSGCSVNCIGPKWSPNGRFIVTGRDNQVYVLNGDVTAHRSSNGTASIVDLVANLTVATSNETAPAMIVSALAWSPDAQFLAVGGGATGSGHVWVYQSWNWTAPPLVAATDLGYGVDSLAWRSSSSIPNTTTKTSHAWQLAVGTGRVIEIWQVTWANAESANASATIAPTLATATDASMSTTTPTTVPLLAIVASPQYTSTGVSAVPVIVTGPTTTTSSAAPSGELQLRPPTLAVNNMGFSNVNSNSTHGTSLSAAAVSGVSIGATALTIVCAIIALLACRKRHLSRPKPLRQLHDTIEGPGTDGQVIHTSSPLGTKVIVPMPVDVTEDHTGDEDDCDPQDDVHFDRVLAMHSVISGTTPSDHELY